MDDRMMRAVLFDRYGPPEVLYTARVPRPEPGPGEVLVRVRAFSVNGGETAARAGRVHLLTGRRFPQRTGLDFAGEVAALGVGATGFSVGEPVWGVLGRTSGFGSAAEYVVASPERMGRIPDGTDPVAAAALPVATTAVTALRDKARLRPGERLLIRGAAGGVGNAAVQLGRAYGAKVTALAGTPTSTSSATSGHTRPSTTGRPRSRPWAVSTWSWTPWEPGYRPCGVC